MYSKDSKKRKYIFNPFLRWRISKLERLLSKMNACGWELDYTLFRSCLFVFKRCPKSTEYIYYITCTDIYCASEKPWTYGYDALCEALKTSTVNRNVFKKFSLNVLKYKENEKTINLYNRKIITLYSVYRFPAGYAKVIDIAKEKRKSQRFRWTCYSITVSLIVASLSSMLVLTLIAVLITLAEL